MKQVAVYVLAQSGNKSVSNSHKRHNDHQHLHRRKRIIKKLRERELTARAVGDIVTATIDGQIVSWTNVYAGPDVTTPITSLANKETMAPVSVVSTSSVVDAIAFNAPGDSWLRQAYYSAEGGISQGFTFLNHLGGMAGILGTADGGSP